MEQIIKCKTESTTYIKIVIECIWIKKTIIVAAHSFIEQINSLSEN